MYQHKEEVSLPIRILPKYYCTLATELNIFLLQLEEKPAPKDAEREPFQYMPTAPVPLYGKNAPTLEKVLFATPEMKRRRDDACQPSAKKPRMTKAITRKKRAPILSVSDSDDVPVCSALEELWSEISVF